ncbi:MAG: GspE/PulE family protein [Patescibacteria group bacterium]
MDPKTTSDLKSQLDLMRREAEERQAQRLARDLGYEYVDLSKTPASVDALRLVPEAEAKNAKIATIELKGRKTALAALSPKLPASQKVIKDLVDKKYELKVFVASASGLEGVWKLYRFIHPEAEEITGRVTIEEKKVEEFMARLKSFDAIRKEFSEEDFSKLTPTKLIEVLLGGALSLRASDIHTEAEENASKLRLRVDGVLHDIFDKFPKDFYERTISRIKLLAGLKINIRDQAQDGRFTIKLGKKEVEIRVSVIPAEYGENVVMRILDPEVTSIGLSRLGLRDDDLVIVERQIAKPNGLILNTGPTGSGKTTTLYAFLRHINNPEIKIITLEDPIEYRLEGVEQTQVDEESGYTFASGLRAIVRQDPDVVLVGEIRDEDTSDIALQASLTGHLVLSTLHTNDAIGAIPRLINLGAKVETIGPALNVIIAQRLVREICPYCKKEIKIQADLKGKLEKLLKNLPARVNRAKYEKYTLYESAGCEKCSGLGYKGRIGIFEFFEGTPEMEESILKGVSELSLKKLSEIQGMVSMQEDGILKVMAGETDLKEVERITGKIEW